jgi:tetratricopeptide (TPR) repeat protein
LTSGNRDSSGGANVYVDQLTAKDGAVGVKVQVGGRPVAPRSTLLDLGRLFGRNDDLAAISDALKEPHNPARLILSGEPGIGKTHLANAYGADRRTRYPGGMFFIAFNADPALGLAKLIPPLAEESIPDRAARMLASIEEPTLLIYDNVASERELTAWLPPAGLPAHVLVTTTSSDWTGRHAVRNVQPLQATDAQAIVEGVAGQDAARRYGAVLVCRAGGIAVRLRADCDYVTRELRHHREPAFGRKLDSDTESSFAKAFAVLTPDGQLVVRVAALFNQAHIPRQELERRLVSQGWDEQRMQQALDAGVDRRMLTQVNDFFRMHGLVAEFVRAREAQAVPEAILTQHREAFVKAAQAFKANPAETHLREQLAGYPSLVSEWEPMGAPTDGVDCHTISRALAEAGRFSEAREWSERAVAAAEKGDVHGRVDHASLGISVHQVGVCLSRLGQYAEARPWFERAVAAKEEGDVHGRVDHESLGGSVHEVGVCLWSLGQYAEARPWFERAVAESERGDVHGRVDHASLGRSVHQVGYCLSSLSQYVEARPWFERAAAESEKGDVRGRVDHASLGSSVHLVGYCLASLGQYAEARPWFERAAAEAEKGDVHGRVDHQSLGVSLHLVGHCLSSLSQYVEARPWLERAVAAKGKGDVHGRVDHQSLGISLRSLADCLAKLGQPEEAQQCLTRAAALPKDG